MGNGYGQRLRFRVVGQLQILRRCRQRGTRIHKTNADENQDVYEYFTFSEIVHLETSFQVVFI